MSIERVQYDARISVASETYAALYKQFICRRL
jgi:hypothetical protein